MTHLERMEVISKRLDYIITSSFITYSDQYKRLVELKRYVDSFITDELVDEINAEGSDDKT